MKLQEGEMVKQYLEALQEASLALVEFIQNPEEEGVMQVWLDARAEQDYLLTELIRGK
jgi:hypothetical protein